MSDPRDFHAPQSSYTKEDLRRIEPRRLFRPGQCSSCQHRLMMDRIIEISVDGGEFGKGHVIGELDITPDLWFFDCHFSGDAVTGCLGLDAMWQIIGYGLAGRDSQGKGRAVGVGRGEVPRRHKARHQARAIRGQHAPGKARPTGRWNLRTAAYLPTIHAYISPRMRELRSITSERPGKGCGSLPAISKAEWDSYKGDPQFGLMLFRLIISPHFLASACMNSRRADGVETAGSAPTSTMRRRMAGSDMALV